MEGQHWGLIWILWLLPFIAFIGIFFLVNKNSCTYPKEKTPLEILKRRYAKGEINKEQFEQMKKDIAS